uniref:Uncharacterized protein n=1 Tax=Timema cristinae TaxID=61476 RepID=A0A7R9D326_TIMCR|nr:unnamed protein product [Timema cristinae]
MERLLSFKKNEVYFKECKTVFLKNCPKIINLWWSISWIPSLYRLCPKSGSEIVVPCPTRLLQDIPMGNQVSPDNLAGILYRIDAAKSASDVFNNIDKIFCAASAHKSYQHKMKI